jgi:hypothetical protein
MCICASYTSFISLKVFVLLLHLCIQEVFGIGVEVIISLDFFPNHGLGYPPIPI